MLASWNSYALYLVMIFGAAKSDYIFSHMKSLQIAQGIYFEYPHILKHTISL